MVHGIVLTATQVLWLIQLSEWHGQQEINMKVIDKITDLFIEFYKL